MSYTLLHHIEEEVINSDYVGVITTPMADDFVFEDIREVPKVITDITNHFHNQTQLEYNILDCREDDGTTLSTVHYSNINCEDLSMVYLFFDVMCDSDTNITFSIESVAKQRLWINDKLVTLCCTSRKTRRQLFTFTLSKGHNVFCIEQHQSLKFFRTTIRITSFEHELTTEDPSLISGNLHYRKGEIAVAYYDNECYRNSMLNFVCVPVDSVNLDLGTPISFTIEDSDDNSCLYSQQINFYEYVSMDTSFLSFNKKSIYNHAHVVIRYVDMLNEKHEFSFDLHLTEPQGYMEPTQAFAKKLLENSNLSNEAERYIKYQLINIYYLPENDLRAFRTWEKFYGFLEMIERGNYEDYLESSGTKEIYYYSELEDKIIEYRVCLPKGFIRDKTYSLLLINTITDSHDSMYSHYFERTDSFSDLIVADVQGRGMTTGSYIGDAFFREILSDILKNYPINEKKIFSMGQSNGGFATWVIAEKTPQVFAGIMPSTGNYNVREVKNLSNLRIRFLTSNADPGHIHNSENIQKVNDCFKDYKQTTFSQLMHNVFEQVQFSEKAFKELFEAENDPYPNEIYFDTYMNRYRRAYWIEIHSVETGKIYADIHAVIKDGDIHITANNITGLTVNIPPQVDLDSARIYLNGLEFSVDRRKCINLVCSKGECIVSEHKPELPVMYKGTGLIDVYLNPVRIINCNCEDEHFDKVVTSFKKPSMNTYVPSSAEYHVYTLDDELLCEEDFRKNNSFVVIDSPDINKDNIFLNTIRSNLHITCTLNGYEYLDKRYECEYCIMQIAENPWDQEKSVLYVCTNNENLFGRNRFIRQLVLPSYISGFHPYLNVAALVYTNGKYYTIHDYGMDITEADKQ